MARTQCLVHIIIGIELTITEKQLNIQGPWTTVKPLFFHVLSN